MDAPIDVMRPTDRIELLVEAYNPASASDPAKSTFVGKTEVELADKFCIIRGYLRVLLF